MDFINKVKYPISYYAFNDCWDLLDREIKADIVMRFIDNIELESKGKSYSVKQVDFRSTMYEDFKKFCYSKGEGGKIFFDDRWEYCHNSKNPCFSYIQSTLDKKAFLLRRMAEIQH